MNAASCVRFVSWFSKGISISQCSNYIAFKEFKSCYMERHKELMEMILQVTKQEKECELYKSYEKTRKNSWSKRLGKKIKSIFQ